MSRLITFVLLCFSSFTHATIAVDGFLDTTASCNAYISKNKRESHDGVRLQSYTQYEIKEINQDNPDWFRVYVPGVTPDLRWVYEDCGAFSYGKPDKKKKRHEKCKNKPGYADSYVLAVSWHPGFCETYGAKVKKPECKVIAKDAFAKKNMVFHGLWPNQRACGINYGFCDTKHMASHCSYEPVSLTPEVSENLKQVMPSYAHGSCLERHEWNKHGTCQVLTQSKYFNLGIRLSSEVNRSSFVRFISAHVGEVIKKQDLKDQVEKVFGQGSSNKVYLGCTKSTLVDVFISLPALIPYEESLKSLVLKAPDYHRVDDCPENIYISEFEGR